MIDRRAFLGAACAGAAFQRAAAGMQKKVKITGVKCMIVRGTWDWNLIKIETDSGLYGIGEAYWGWGVKDVVLNKMAPIIVGEDPLNVDKLYTKMLMQSAGAGAIAGVTVTAASGIEIALWDLCGRILQTPVCNLLGGRFRDRIRFYRTLQAVARILDESVRDTDIVARYGGEEFVVVLPKTALESACLFAERVRGMVEDSLGLTISGGVAMALDGDNVQSLLSRADAALYSGKAAGRNRIYRHTGTEIEPIDVRAVAEVAG